MKKKFNKKKLLTFGVLGLFAMVLVTAGLITYYTQVQQDFTIQSPIEGTEFTDDVTTGLFGTGFMLGDLITTENVAPFDVNVNVNSVAIEYDIGITTDITTSYVSELILASKGSNWVIDDRMSATLKYTVVGEEFGYNLNVEGLEFNRPYSLIYYADKPERFVNWGGNNPGALIVEANSDELGNLVIEGSVDLGMSLPHENDANVNTDETNYCDVDNFAHCFGAKIWLVPSSDYSVNEKKLIAWNQEDYLYETDLIHYFKTDGSGNTVIPEGVSMEFNPLYEFGAIEGEYKVTTEIVPLTA
jgi:hypothetical protein